MHSGRGRGLATALVSTVALAGGLLVAATPSNAATECGNYGQQPCPVYTLSMNANGGECSPPSVSGYNQDVRIPGCSRAGFTLASYNIDGASYPPGSSVYLSRNITAIANYTANSSATPTPTPTPTPSPTTTPTPEPTPTPTETAVVTPPGQTNPDSPVPIGEGVIVVSQNQADRLVPREVGSASESLKEAPRIPVRAGRAIQPEVSDLPTRVRVTVFVVIDGARVVVGTVRTDRNGSVELPALRFTERGTYNVGLQLPNGDINWLKIRVS